MDEFIQEATNFYKLPNVIPNASITAAGYQMIKDYNKNGRIYNSKTDDFEMKAKEILNKFKAMPNYV
ncbi:hypothetical protein SS50377_26782 [Spironucleus salmonicida]|uniref:Uncharacterized protein n=1 Tax=Spironucleus salmonicida TaxID=348837 RepID=V6LZS5_9EUKA|nr:hypothetical protein SS50377_26782 [Spironucleus salmonicida]|eukprot:EST49251.1 Hypothetical protein SS50377_10471 [Spironucleus salmonicida]